MKVDVIHGMKEEEKFETDYHYTRKKLFGK
jgi:hypothetical protein